MPELEIIKAGLMTSVQDLGRKGFAYYAIPRSGAMDQNAARIALLLLNKNENSPLIECTSTAPHLLFNDPAQIAITGADFNWKVNDEKIHRNTVLEIKTGDVLRGQSASDGLRGYIAIQGTLEVDTVYDSQSTYLNAGIGGFHGRLLKKGDRVFWKEVRTNSSEDRIFPIKKGPEFSYLNEKSKHLLISDFYKIEANSNRMGLRLSGPKLVCSTHQLEFSLPVLPGFIQLPPSGFPIVVLQDGQTSGGYPRIAYLVDQHLATLNQIPLGGTFRFVFE